MYGRTHKSCVSHTTVHRSVSIQQNEEIKLSWVTLKRKMWTKTLNKEVVVVAAAVVIVAVVAVVVVIAAFFVVVCLPCVFVCRGCAVVVCLAW